MKNKRFSMRTITCSMISTLLLLGLFTGFVIAEKNTRRIGFADNAPWLICKDDKQEGHYIGFRFMGKTYTLDFSILYDVTDKITEALNKVVK